jgi:hypothetical protein
MHTKRCKSCIPLHLQVAYLSGFKKGGGGEQGVCNLIYKSLFYYYSDLFYLLYYLLTFTPHLSPYLFLLAPISLSPSTLTYPLPILPIYFLINKRENRLTFYDFNKKRRERERESINLPFVFFKEGRREGEKKREK